MWAEGGRKRTISALEFWKSRQHSRSSEKEKTGSSPSQGGRKEVTRKQMGIERFFTQERKEKENTDKIRKGFNLRKTSVEPEAGPQESKGSQGK